MAPVLEGGGHGQTICIDAVCKRAIGLRVGVTELTVPDSTAQPNSAHLDVAVAHIVGDVSVGTRTLLVLEAKVRGGGEEIANRLSALVKLKDRRSSAANLLRVLFGQHGNHRVLGVHFRQVAPAGGRLW